MTTVKEAEAMYTKSEIERAKTAHELIKNSGYPSMGELIEIIEDGNILNLPELLEQISNELMMSIERLQNTIAEN